MQERHNSIANALELRLSCTNPLIYSQFFMPEVCCTCTMCHPWVICKLCLLHVLCSDMKSAGIVHIYEVRLIAIWIVSKFQVFFMIVQSNLSYFEPHIDGIVQDCSISSVLAVELLQSFTKPSMLLLSDVFINLVLFLCSLTSTQIDWLTH